MQRQAYSHLETDVEFVTRVFGTGNWSIHEGAVLDDYIWTTRRMQRRLVWVY